MAIVSTKATLGVSPQMATIFDFLPEKVKTKEFTQKFFTVLTTSTLNPFKRTEREEVSNVFIANKNWVAFQPQGVFNALLDYELSGLQKTITEGGNIIDKLKSMNQQFLAADKKVAAKNLPIAQPVKGG